MANQHQRQSYTSSSIVDHPSSDPRGQQGNDPAGPAKLTPDGSDNSAVYIVDWDGPEDPENPKNWPFRKKWAATLVVSAYTFMCPASSSMMAPASDAIAAKFGETNPTVVALFTSVFVCGFAFGPLVLGPLSEVFGRARVLQGANLWYLLWNLGCAFARNKGQLLAFRFLAGFGGSGTLTIGGGVLGDVWRPEQRGKAVAIYSLAPLLGPVLGPVCGAWVAQKGDWRWVFWAPSIVSVATQIVGLWFLKETFAPVILERKAEKVRQGLDPEKARQYEVRTILDGSDRGWKNMVQKALFRPFVLFAHEPILQLFGAYMALVYGLLYLFLTTIPGIFEGIYKESVGVAGLNYIALGLGLTGISQLNAPFIDYAYKYLCAKNGGVGKPEYRLPSMVPGTILLPIGLLWTGWSAREGVHWIVPDIGIFVVGAGMILNFQTIQTYVIDAFTLHAASALAAVTFFRSLAGFGFPLFAPPMYAALGYGRGDTILACVAIAIGVPAPFLFWFYGERIRNASKYAKRT